jgi:hypothetical protein
MCNEQSLITLCIPRIVFAGEQRQLQAAVSSQSYSRVDKGEHIRSRGPKVMPISVEPMAFVSILLMGKSLSYFTQSRVSGSSNRGPLAAWMSFCSPKLQEYTLDVGRRDGGGRGLRIRERYREPLPNLGAYVLGETKLLVASPSFKRLLTLLVHVWGMFCLLQDSSEEGFVVQ